MSKTITVIEFLKLISFSNIEIIPKKIKFKDSIYRYHVDLMDYYCPKNGTYIWFIHDQIRNIRDFDNKVTIIEAENKDTRSIEEYTNDELEYMCPEELKPLAYKINEIIKATNKNSKEIKEIKEIKEEN